jgi:hypothetical protein
MNRFSGIVREEVAAYRTSVQRVDDQRRYLNDQFEDLQRSVARRVFQLDPPPRVPRASQKPPQAAASTARSAAAPPPAPVPLWLTEVHPSEASDLARPAGRQFPAAFPAVQSARHRRTAKPSQTPLVIRRMKGKLSDDDTEWDDTESQQKV